MISTYPISRLVESRRPSTDPAEGELGLSRRRFPLWLNTTKDTKRTKNPRSIVLANSFVNFVFFVVEEHLENPEPV